MVDGGEDSILSCMTFVFQSEEKSWATIEIVKGIKDVICIQVILQKKKWNFFLQMMVSSLRMAVDGGYQVQTFYTHVNIEAFIVWCDNKPFARGA